MKAAFRLGDVRGIYPSELNEDFAERFAHAFIHRFKLSGSIATGRDMRQSSPELQSALNRGLMDSGMHVVDMGLCTTELGYFASTKPNICATIVVTASHNPKQYNGFKCVLSMGEAVTFETGLSDVMELMLSGHRNHGFTGHHESVSFREEYIAYLASHFSPATLQSGPVAINGLNGTAATIADDMIDTFNLSCQWFRKEPGPIPSEGADPSTPRLAAQMKGFMSEQDFHFGVAWDGDCDRCVFFDSDGNLIPTYYMVGLFADHFLSLNSSSAIVFDSKLCWNTLDIIQRHGGIAIPAETGHAFMKRQMRQHNAVYGGELSSHHYFNNFFGCDSGMFAWLTVLKILNQSDRPIGDLVAERRRVITCTPEINIQLTDVERAFEETLSYYRAKASTIDEFDGLSFEMPGDWRFSLRSSKTEPVVRLNFESRHGHDDLLQNAELVLKRLAVFQASEQDWTTQLGE